MAKNLNFFKFTFLGANTLKNNIFIPSIKSGIFFFKVQYTLFSWQNLYCNFYCAFELFGNLNLGQLVGNSKKRLNYISPRTAKCKLLFLNVCKFDINRLPLLHNENWYKLTVSAAQHNENWFKSIASTAQWKLISIDCLYCTMKIDINRLPLLHNATVNAYSENVTLLVVFGANLNP